MNYVNWGIIGAGNVCEKKSGPAFYKIKHSSLIAIMCRDELKAKDFTNRHKISKYYINVDQLINDQQINAVYIATPPHLHKEYAIKVMEAGKAVYVEKPMALNYEDCKEMLKVSEITNQKLFVAFYRRALPYFLKVKSLLEKKLIGDVLTVNTNLIRSPRIADLDTKTQTWHVNRDIGGEGYFMDLAPHTLDILDFLLGKIIYAKGFSQNLGNLYSVKDTTSAVLKFESGVSGTGQWCFVAAKNAEKDTIEIIGTKGKISFSTFAFTPILVENEERTDIYETAQPEHVQQPLIESIVDELRGIGKCPSNGISATRTAMVIDQILKD